MASYQLQNAEAENFQHQDPCSPRYFSVPLVMPPLPSCCLKHSLKKTTCKPTALVSIIAVQLIRTSALPSDINHPSCRQVCRRPGD